MTTECTDNERGEGGQGGNGGGTSNAEGGREKHRYSVQTEG